MESSRRAGLLIAAAGLALAVVLFVLLSGGDDDSQSTAVGTPSEQQAPAPSGGYGPAPAQDEPGGAQEQQPEPEEPDVQTVKIEGGQPVGGVQELEFPSGERAEFAVESNIADELHLHGYDVYVDVAPGKTETVSFDADIEGLFELESHSTGALFAEISVVPD